MPGETLSRMPCFFLEQPEISLIKKFPALHSMVRHGTLKVPVVGIAKSGWTIDQLRERARDSIEKFGGGVDDTAFGRLLQLLYYIDGDYGSPATFSALRTLLGNARRPAHYLAIPPKLFATAVKALEASWCATGARVIVEKRMLQFASKWSHGDGRACLY